MNNIERFNDCTAKLLATLYAEFPHRLDIDYHEWLSMAYGEAKDEDYAFCESTLSWLSEAGYVDVKIFHSMGAAKMVLTAKGLEILKVVPESLKSKESIGDALVRSLKSGAFEVAKDLVSAAFTQGFKLMVNHV